MKRTTEEYILLGWIIALAVVCLFLSVKHVLAADARYCGVVYRDAVTKKILRSAAVKAAFKREHPCIAPCDATWEVDHILPLFRGGCDSVINMQWLPPQLKTCAMYCKDRWEGILYNNTTPLIVIYK